MTRDEIRLECLKLACARVPGAELAVATARVFEAYLTERDAPVEMPKRPVGRPKKAANPFEE